MLRQSFCHIPGIGETVEQSLWRSGCKDWGTALAEFRDHSFGSADRRLVQQYLKGSEYALEIGDHQFFARGLRQKQAWRAYEEFKPSTVYLDIETDGGSSGASITMIGLYDGAEFLCLRRGEDLDSFRDVVTRYSQIVTFFGTGFDLPMLLKRFPDVRFDQIHFDLCPALRRLGYRGGLKKIERQLGISRGEESDGLNGLDAIRLWNRFEKLGDDQALETLVAYNKEDVVNLEYLAQVAFSGLYAETYLAIVDPERAAETNLKAPSA